METWKPLSGNKTYPLNGRTGIVDSLAAQRITYSSRTNIRKSNAQESACANVPYMQKPLSEFLPRGVDVLRTGIEPYMIISKLPYLQAVLQAVKEDFCKFCNYCSSGFSKGSSSGD